MTKQERESSSYQCEDDAYLVGDRVYNKQYAHLYFQRLHIIAPALTEKAKAKWPGVPAKKILEIVADQDCLVVGTIYKDMKLKPTILDEYTKGESEHLVGAGAKFIEGDDSLILEDEGARMKLSGGSLVPGSLVSGVIVAVKGREIPGGDFEVKDFCFFGPRSQIERPPLATPKYVLLTSGLNIGGKQDPMPMQLLIDYIIGFLDLDMGNGVNAQSIVRVVLAGNTIKNIEESPVETDKEVFTAESALKEADMSLTQLASSLPVDLMPGPLDPANISLPQQPFHKCLFPSTTCYSTFGRVTNPHKFCIDGVHFLGTSGQNVDDIYQYVEHEDRMKIMTSTLEWGHLVPTAPDTLPCFPFFDKEPFILKESPHVYFIGNQKKFETSVLEGEHGLRTRIVSVPSFSSTGTAVLVNLKDLSCQPLDFSTHLLENGVQ